MSLDELIKLEEKVDYEIKDISDILYSKNINLYIINCFILEEYDNVCLDIAFDEDTYELGKAMIDEDDDEYSIPTNAYRIMIDSSNSDILENIVLQKYLLWKKNYEE